MYTCLPIDAIPIFNKGDIFSVYRLARDEEDFLKPGVNLIKLFTFSLTLGQIKLSIDILIK